MTKRLRYGMKRYQSPGEAQSISDRRARNIDDAARMFAHRAARAMFGRSGRCVTIKRAWECSNGTVQYKAVLGKGIGGVRCPHEFWVFVDRATCRKIVLNAR